MYNEDYKNVSQQVLGNSVIRSGSPTCDNSNTGQIKSFYILNIVCQIEARNRNIAWLTPTGVQFPNIMCFRYGNFFIPWVEKSLKISLWEGKAYLLGAYGSWQESFFFLKVIFGGFFNPWDEEISIPETQPIRKSYISSIKPKCYNRQTIT